MATREREKKSYHFNRQQHTPTHSQNQERKEKDRRKCINEGAYHGECTLEAIHHILYF